MGQSPSFSLEAKTSFNYQNIRKLEEGGRLVTTRRNRLLTCGINVVKAFILCRVSLISASCSDGSLPQMGRTIPLFSRQIPILGRGKTRLPLPTDSYSLRESRGARTSFCWSQSGAACFVVSSSRSCERLTSEKGPGVSRQLATSGCADFASKTAAARSVSKARLVLAY